MSQSLATLVEQGNEKQGFSLGQFMGGFGDFLISSGGKLVDSKIAERNQPVTDPSQLNTDSAAGELAASGKNIFGMPQNTVVMGGAALAVLLLVGIAFATRK